MGIDPSWTTGRREGRGRGNACGTTERTFGFHLGMTQSKSLAGWDEEKVRQVLAHYEKQTEDEALVEDEAGMESTETVMTVPRDLVPKVRELIAKRRG